MSQVIEIASSQPFTDPQMVRLGDHLNVIRGASPRPKGDPRYFGGDIPWISISDITREPGKYLSRTREFVTRAGAEKSRLLPAGTLILSNSGTVCVPKILRVDGCIHDGFVAFPDLPDSFDKNYLYWFFEYVRPSIIEANRQGITQINLNTGIVREIRLPLTSIVRQREIVAELEKQFSRLDEAVANLQRVKANLKRYERATIASLTNPESFDACVSGTIADVAISLDNMRKPVNKLERAKRPGNIPYLGANGQTGWIDVPLFDEELVLVVEDETFVGRTDPFCYYFADACWVNNHTHVLRARPEVVSAKYLNLALSYYPFIPLTTGSTGRRKLTKAALMSAPISVPSLKRQAEVIDEVERCLSIAREVEAEVDTNLKRAQALRQGTLAKVFTNS